FFVTVDERAASGYDSPSGRKGGSSYDPFTPTRADSLPRPRHLSRSEAGRLPSKKDPASLTMQQKVQGRVSVGDWPGLPDVPGPEPGWWRRDSLLLERHHGNLFAVHRPKSAERWQSPVHLAQGRQAVRRGREGRLRTCLWGELRRGKRENKGIP